jgi:hypothetical protein
MTRINRQQSLFWVVAMIGGTTWVHLGVFHYDVRHPRDAAVEALRREFVEKCEPLATRLPSGEVVDFVLDRDHRDPAWSELGGWLYLAQYVLSPHLLATDVPSPWIVVDSAWPSSVPAIAQSSGWILVVDLHNGIRLYRKNLRE